LNHDNFINVKLRPGNLDVYILRASIKDAINRMLPQFKGILIDVGCGQMPYKQILTSRESRVKQYIGLDFENNVIYKNTPDITWKAGKIPLKDNSVDCAIATEVFEHCPDPEKVMREIIRVLKPSGLLFFTVPFVWPLHNVPYDEYRYTPFSLKRHLAVAGFVDIDLKPLGGWDASLAQMIGLWARRRPMNKLLRIFFSVMMTPIIHVLNKKDKCKKFNFQESVMITGISGNARKPLPENDVCC
jgi:SAM-dependent methyltransferase